jgi:putative ABC transport system substrate-binding protein
VNRRRALIGIFGLGAGFAAGRTALAQSKSPAVIGWLNFSSREVDGSTLVAFKEGLAAQGWNDSTRFMIEERWANGRIERLTPLAEELAVKKPAVVVVWPTQTLAACVKAMPGVPMVQVSAADPVVTGFAASLARPGGMVTGLSNVVTDIFEKFLELLLAAVPKLRRVGFLDDSTNFARVKLMDAAKRSVAKRGIEARFAEAARPEDIEPAISRLAAEGVQALIVSPSPLFTFDRSRIVGLALKRRWPVIASSTFSDAGALLSYGVDVLAQFRRGAYYVDRILKGAKPGDLPIEQPTTVELRINLKTAKALGITIPRTILLRADEVIE